jgi:hypothetical protein
MPVKQVQPSMRVGLEDVIQIHRLANIAYRWAGAALSITKEELAELTGLCAQYELEPAEVLYRFQEFWADSVRDRSPEAKQILEAIETGGRSRPVNEEVPS